MNITSFESVNGRTWVLAEGLCVLGNFKSEEEASEAMTTRYQKDVACLDCGAPINSASRPDSRLPDIKPKAGDIAICFRCQHVMIYADDQGALRPPTDEDVLEIAGDPELVAANKALAAYWRKERNT